MAKFKIDVEIDWIDEDGTLDDQIKENIKNSIVEKIEKTVMNDIKEIAAEEAAKRIGLWINKLIETMAKERTIPFKRCEYDSKVEMITIEEMFGRQFESAIKLLIRTVYKQIVVLIDTVRA